MEKVHPPRGPVAQLGARFHGMEEVVSSNLTRSTKLLNRFQAFHRFRILADPAQSVALPAS